MRRNDLFDVLDDDSPAPHGLQYRSFTSDNMKLDDAGALTHKISDSSMDRMNDVIESTGWDTENFMKNPVVLADHKYNIERIIGTSLGVTAKTTGLFAKTQFDDDGLGAIARGLVQRGLAKAWSVGFRSKDVHSIMQGLKQKCKRCKSMKAQLLGDKDPDETSFFWGHHFVAQELVEYSLVAVPANPNAVMGMIAEGKCDVEQADVLFTYMSEEDIEAIPKWAKQFASEFQGFQGKILSIVSGLEESTSQKIHDLAEGIKAEFEARGAVIPVADIPVVTLGNDDDVHKFSTNAVGETVTSTGKTVKTEVESPSGPQASAKTEAAAVDPPKPTLGNRLSAMAELAVALRRNNRDMEIHSATRNINRS